MTFVIPRRAAVAHIACMTNKWKDAPLAAVATHIVSMYHVYTRNELAALASMGERVLIEHRERHPELSEVVALIGDLTADMLPHMLKEEQVLFPYVSQLEGGNAVTPFFGTVKNPVRKMMLDHDRVEELLTRLRRVTRDYAPPAGAGADFHELYRRLGDFDQLTREHVEIENAVYFPRAVELEERAGSPANFAFACNH